MKRKLAYFFGPLLVGLAFMLQLSLVPTVSGQGTNCPPGQLSACLGTCPDCQGLHGVNFRECDQLRSACIDRCNAECQPPGQQ
jgi:hypothetical protein